MSEKQRENEGFWNNSQETIPTVKTRRVLQGASFLPSEHRQGSKSFADGWCLGLPETVHLVPHSLPYIIAVGGGKGGVGKTLISSNLAALLATKNKRVLVVDLDLGGPNLHTHFGIAQPKTSLVDCAVYGQKNLREIILPTPISNVGLISAGSAEVWKTQVNSNRSILTGFWHQLLRSKVDLKADYVVLDLGAGTDLITMESFCFANLGILTVLAEPTSIENTYAFLKATLWTLIENVGKRSGHFSDSMQIRNAINFPLGQVNHGYPERLEDLRQQYPQQVALLFEAMAARTMGIVLNQTRTKSDEDVGKAMQLICKQHFGFDTMFLGALGYDDAVWKSQRNNKLLILDNPTSKTGLRLLKLSQSVKTFFEPLNEAKGEISESSVQRAESTL